MTKAEFTNELENILGAPAGTLQLEQKLDGFVSWDSMAKMATLTLIYDASSREVPYDFLKSLQTVGDIVRFVEGDLK